MEEETKGLATAEHGKRKLAEGNPEAGASGEDFVTPIILSVVIIAASLLQWWAEQKAEQTMEALQALQGTGEMFKAVRRGYERLPFLEMIFKLIIIYFVFVKMKQSNSDFLKKIVGSIINFHIQLANAIRYFIA